MRKATLAILLTLFVSTTAAVRAEDAPKGDKPGGGDKAAAAPAPARKFVTRHRFNAGGVDIPYTATAEYIDLKDRDGKPTARFFTISYMAEGVKRQEDRPITFIVPWAAGGGADFASRLLAQALERELGVPVNVVNRTGEDQNRFLLYAVARQGGEVVAAGRGAIEHLKPETKKVPYNIYFIGDPEGADLSLYEYPTLHPEG